MKSFFIKTLKTSMELAMDVSNKKHKNITEEDLDVLAESIEILNDVYETLYDEVFVEVGVINNSNK
jgi:hypothetical protein